MAGLLVGVGGLKAAVGRQFARTVVTLAGKTPNEVYFSRPADSEQPRHEPRERWPRGSPCAKPQVDVAGESGDPIVLDIDCLEGRRHLPIIRADALRSRRAVSACATGPREWLCWRHCRPNCQRSCGVLSCFRRALGGVCLGLSVIMFTTKVDGPIQAIWRPFRLIRRPRAAIAVGGPN